MSGFVKFYRNVLYSDLSAVAKIVYVAIVDRYEAEQVFNNVVQGDMITISIAALADKLSIQRRACTQALKELYDAGWIVLTIQHGKPTMLGLPLSNYDNAELMKKQK